MKAVSGKVIVPESSPKVEVIVSFLDPVSLAPLSNLPKNPGFFLTPASPLVVPPLVAPASSPPSALPASPEASHSWLSNGKLI